LIEVSNTSQTNQAITLYLLSFPNPTFSNLITLFFLHLYSIRGCSRWPTDLEQPKVRLPQQGRPGAGIGSSSDCSDETGLPYSPTSLRGGAARSLLRAACSVLCIGACVTHFRINTLHTIITLSILSIVANDIVVFHQTLGDTNRVQPVLHSSDPAMFFYCLSALIL
jgi:hypothetical protein